MAVLYNHTLTEKSVLPADTALEPAADKSAIGPVCPVSFCLKAYLSVMVLSDQTLMVLSPEPASSLSPCLLNAKDRTFWLVESTEFVSF